MAKSGKAMVVEIPRPQWEPLLITVVGDTPLLVQRFSEKPKKDIQDKQGGKATQKKPPRIPEEEFYDAHYRIPKRDGAPERFGFPVIAFGLACVRAGKLVGLAMIDLKTLFQISSPDPRDGDLVPLEYDDLVEDSAGVTGRLGGKTGTLIYRPAFHGWRATLKIERLANLISAEQIINLLNLAGLTVGVGGHRPEKNGSNGRFHVQTTEE